MENTSSSCTSKISYDSLCTAEIENLHDACMSAIEGKHRDATFRSKLSTFFRDICFCGDSFDIDVSVNESLFSMMFYLEKNAWNIKKVFIDQGSEREAKGYAKLVEMNEEISYTDAHPNAVASGFKIYVEDNLKTIVPPNVTRKLIKAYEENDMDEKNKIVPRVPFILSDSHRLFIKSLKKVFLAIETSAQDNEVDINEVYDIFAPIIIRRPDDMLNTDERMLRAALTDIMAVDFEEIPMSFYSY